MFLACTSGRSSVPSTFSLSVFCSFFSNTGASDRIGGNEVIRGLAGVARSRDGRCAFVAPH